MAKPKVFVTRIIPDKGLDLVKDFCEVDLWTEDLPPSQDELLRRVKGVDGLLSLLTDDILNGKKSVIVFQKTVVWLVASRFIGTVLALIIFIPCSQIILLVSRMIW